MLSTEHRSNFFMQLQRTYKAVQTQKWVPEEGFVFLCWIILVLSSFSFKWKQKLYCASGPFYSPSSPNSKKGVSLDWTVAGVNFHIHVQQTQIQVSRGIRTSQLALGLPWAAGPLRAPSSRRTHPFKLWCRQMLSLCLVFVQKLYKKLNLLGVKSNRNKVRSVWIMLIIFQSSYYICPLITKVLFCSIGQRDTMNFTDVYGIKESLFKLTSPTPSFYR